MELRDYIKQGEEAKGTGRALATYLDQAATTLADAKAGRRGLPDFACVKLAALIGVDTLEVIAASQLVTETKPERREVWLPFVRQAAMLSAFFVAVTVTNVVTMSDAQATESTTYNSSASDIQIIRSRIVKWIRRASRRVMSLARSSWQVFVGNWNFAGSC